jgi:FixJ family two-component response regulator
MLRCAGVFGLPTAGCSELPDFGSTNPGLSGFDLQSDLAKADVRLPIIFLTGRGDIPTSTRAITAGAQEFLTKPFNDEALLDAVQQAITYSFRTPGSTTPEKR